jgi:hypothetical protein
MRCRKRKVLLTRTTQINKRRHTHKRRSSEEEARNKAKLLEKLLKYKQEKIKREKEKLELEEKEREMLMRKEHQENVKRMRYNAKLKEKLQKWEQLKIEKRVEKPKAVETERKKNSKTSHTHNRSFFRHRQKSQNDKMIKKRFASLAKPIIMNSSNVSDIYQDQNYINIRTDFVDYKSIHLSYLF